MVKLLTLLSVFLIASGFQLLTLDKWNVDKENYPVLWVKIDRDILDTTFSEFGFPDAADSPQDLPAPQQMIKVVKDVLADYNAVATSFLHLQLYPVDGYSYGTEPGDISFDADAAAARTIKVGFGGSGAASGFAIPRHENGSVVGCDITIKKSSARDARFFRHLLAHELGHCLGLAHNHSSTQAMMSYNRDTTLYKLSADDKMGITYLYPAEDRYAEESASLGLSCSRRK